MDALDEEAYAALVEAAETEADRREELADAASSATVRVEPAPAIAPVDDPMGMDGLRASLEAPRWVMSVLPLSAPPRAVPRGYVFLEALRSGPFGPPQLTSWVIALVLLPFAIPLLAQAPFVWAALSAVWLLAAIPYATAKTIRQVRMLRWGVPAKAVRVASVGDRWIRYKSMAVATANGWNIDDSSFTGSGRHTVLAYEADGRVHHTGEYDGREYAGGLVLHDARDPSCAMRVEELLCMPHPDMQGAWWPEHPWIAMRRSTARRVVFGFQVLALVVMLAGCAYGLTLVVGGRSH
jgi:hypothetical protein